MAKQLKICILDPGLQTLDGALSNNLGDLIIQEAVLREVNNLFPDSRITHVSSHEPLRSQERYALLQQDLILVGGSNLLQEFMRPRAAWQNQWAIDIYDAVYIRKAVLLGVGMQKYKDNAISKKTRVMLALALGKGALHSVRDEYTCRKLHQAGFRNAINTGCVTMWPFAERRMEDVPTGKSEHVLVMLTDYDQAPDADRHLLHTLQEQYKTVFAWPQGSRDIEYLRDLNFTGTLVERSLSGLDELLQSDLSLDYIGTRLHGGVRCLMNNRRSLILEIDNRASEIAKDINLPTCKRDDFERISHWIEGSPHPAIKMHTQAIDTWRHRLAKMHRKHLANGQSPTRSVIHKSEVGIVK